MNLSNLTKRQIRYWCFRFKTEANGGPNAASAPKGLRKHFEENEYFTGWDKFDETSGWDVDYNAPLEMRGLKFSSASLWNTELEKSVKPFPGLK